MGQRLLQWLLIQTGFWLINCFHPAFVNAKVEKTYRRDDEMSRPCLCSVAKICKGRLIYSWKSANSIPVRLQSSFFISESTFSLGYISSYFFITDLCWLQRWSALKVAATYILPRCAWKQWLMLEKCCSVFRRSKQVSSCLKWSPLFWFTFFDCCLASAKRRRLKAL